MVLLPRKLKLIIDVQINIALYFVKNHENSWLDKIVTAAVKLQ